MSPTSTPTSDAARPTTTAAAAPGVAQLRPDGLGVATFGDDMDATMAALSAAFGPPDDPGVVRPGECHPELVGRVVRWGYLQVWFAQHGAPDHLTFGGFNYGPEVQFAGSDASAAVSPALTTPGGFGVKDHAEPLDQLVSEARRDFPNAQLDDSANPSSRALSQGEAGFKFLSTLRQEGGGWFVRYIEIAFYGDMPPC